MRETLLLLALCSACVDQAEPTGPDASACRETAVQACGYAPIYPDPAPAFTHLNEVDVAVLTTADWARTERWMIQMRAWRDCVEVP